VGVSRYLRFNTVGLAGFGLQLAVVWALTRWAGVPAPLATAAAVEAALLHNFFWHERWTWRDRRRQDGPLLNRLLRFHLANGLVSLVGNVAIVGALAGVRPVAANAIAVGICSLVNFAAGDRFVFSRSLPAERSSPTYP
jgi:putative flippase GtrA